MDLGNVVIFKQRAREAVMCAQIATLLLPLESVEQAKENLLRLQVAVELALMTLEGATVHGDKVALDGALDVLRAAAAMIS